MQGRHLPEDLSWNLLRGEGLQNKDQRMDLQLVTGRDMTMGLAAAGGVLLAIALVFYDSFLSLPFLIPVGIFFLRRFLSASIRRHRQELLLEFKEMILCLMTSMKAGESPENAIPGVLREMRLLYGPNAAICRELKIMEGGLQNHIPIEHLLMEFAARCQMEEIYEFAATFDIARHSSGSLVQIMQRTIDMITDRIDTENEIQVLLSSRRLEQTIMELVPFGIILYIGAGQKGFFDMMYHNPAGILIMSLCLGAYLFAIGLSDQILKGTRV